MQVPHAGRALKISEVVLVAEYLMLGSMCSREGMSIFMGKPGRYRFPLLEIGEGQRPVRKAYRSLLQFLPSLPSDFLGLPSLWAPPLPSPIRPAATSSSLPCPGANLPILLLALGLNCPYCSSHLLLPGCPLTSHPSTFFPAWVLPHLSS